jgi:hypothetical protein
MQLALCAAKLAEGGAIGSHGGAFVDAVRGIREHLSEANTLTPSGIGDKVFPNRPLTIVPLAIVLATVMESAEAAIVLAANIGGDSDSVASIAGGILGARLPSTVNSEWYAVVERVNNHELLRLAEDLSAIRC